MGNSVAAQYGIFSGSFDEDEAMWLESVEDFDSAYNRMKQIATERPGKYFIFSRDATEALASIDTTDGKS